MTTTLTLSHPCPVANAVAIFADNTAELAKTAYNGVTSMASGAKDLLSNVPWDKTTTALTTALPIVAGIALTVAGTLVTGPAAIALPVIAGAIELGALAYKTYETQQDTKDNKAIRGPHTAQLMAERTNASATSPLQDTAIGYSL